MSGISKGSSTKVFRVGNKVLVRIVASRIRARIIEDRGPIGAGGRHLYRVQPIGRDSDPEQTFEVPGEMMTAVREK